MQMLMLLLMLMRLLMLLLMVMVIAFSDFSHHQLGRLHAPRPTSAAFCPRRVEHSWIMATNICTSAFAAQVLTPSRTLWRLSSRGSSSWGTSYSYSKSKTLTLTFTLTLTLTAIVLIRFLIVFDLGT